MSTKPNNDWEIESIHFGSLPPLPASMVKAQFVDGMDAGSESPTLIPADNRPDEKKPKGPSIDDRNTAPDVHLDSAK